MIYPIKLMLIIIVICAVLFELTSCKKMEVDKGHHCRWELCPYKGISSDQFGKAVAAYVGNSESDAFSIDMLHLYSPKAEYEELETMLFED